MERIRISKAKHHSKIVAFFAADIDRALLNAKKTTRQPK